MGHARANAISKQTELIYPRNKTRTKYLKSIKAPTATRCFKPGTNNKKIGGPVVTKGRWRGMPIFTSTLEERETCPPHCEQWDDCYGNNMPFGARIDHTDPAFYQIMENELSLFDLHHPFGYVIRPHILGDYFNEAYVRWWGDQVTTRPLLHGWGFTHHRSDDPLGLLIDQLINNDRVNIRFSDDPNTVNSTKVVENWDYIPAKDELVCPEQLAKTSSCATCSLCWEQPDKRIVFLRH